MTPHEHHPHGTAARYSHGPAGDGVDPCREDCCRLAKNAAARERYRQHAYGRPSTVDAEPARRHVRSLQAGGMSLRRIAVASGVSGRSISVLLYGRPCREQPPTRWLRPTTAARLLAVEGGLENLDPQRAVPIIGTRRRLQALIACGWGTMPLSKRLGLAHHRHIYLLLVYRNGCSAATALAARALYEELWNTEPPRRDYLERQQYSRALGLARRHGWVLPAAWDDDEIDDPTATPHTPGPSRGVDPDEVEWLAVSGVPVDEIAARLRCKAETVRAMRTHGTSRADRAPARAAS